LQNISLEIIKKIQTKNKKSSLAYNFSMLCKNLLDFISSNSYSFINIYPEKAPIFIISCIASLAHSQYFIYQSLPENEREELFQYIFEWADISPKEIENILVTTSKTNYDHININKSMEDIINYLKIIESIWNKINMLEFIGQIKENMVVTKETIQKEEHTKKRWSILD